MNKRTIGGLGEEKAASYIIEKGYLILETNFSRKTGEIDIIERDGKTTVFIEVKYRKNAAMDMPSEAVYYYKQQRIIKTASLYAVHHRLMEKPLRFDIIEIIGDQINHYENAFQLLGHSSFL